MNPLRTSRNLLKTSQDRSKRFHAPSEELHRPSIAPPATFPSAPGDHSGPLSNVLELPRAPQRYTISENRRPHPSLTSGFCARLGPGKRAFHTIEVAEMREFRVLAPPALSQDLQGLPQSSQDRPRAPPCTPKIVPGDPMHPLKTSKDLLSGPPETFSSAPGNHSGPLSNVFAYVGPC